MTDRPAHMDPKNSFQGLILTLQQFWAEQGLLTSRQSPEPPKLRPALREGIVYALCHAA